VRESAPALNTANHETNNGRSIDRRIPMAANARRP
jgi:hypothetical protein